MMHYRSIALLSLLHFLGCFASPCPPTGPVLPLPKIPSDFPLPGLTKVLKEFIADSKDNGWNSSTNSFSVVATSPEHTFFHFHYPAPLRNNSGVDKVDGDTIYRVASVTKVFTVLAIWLEERMNLDDPIGKYIKELDIPGWEDVTLRLLTSQIAAIPRDGMLA
jgi:CubicO group peptidase (beta-lactamase class C family)